MLNILSASRGEVKKNDLPELDCLENHGKPFIIADVETWG